MYKKVGVDHRGNFFCVMKYGSGKWNCIDCEYPRSFKHGPGHHWFSHHAQPHEYRW